MSVSFAFLIISQAEREPCNAATGIVEKCFQKSRSCGFGAVWQLVFWRWNSLRCVCVRGMAVARTIIVFDVCFI